MNTKNINNPYVGAVCKKGNRIVIESTPAGYCLSTWDDEGPCCRISGYSATEKGAKLLVPDRISEETLFCNGGCGCGIQKTGAEKPLEAEKKETDMLYFAVVETSAKLVAVPRKLIEGAAKRIPGSWTDSNIAHELVRMSYDSEEIVLLPEDIVWVDLIELEDVIDGEYSYLLDSKDKAQVLTELSVE